MATSITFTFANGQITGTSPQFYEVDVMANAGAAGTKIGDTQVYFNFNTAGFDSFIVTNSKLTVTASTLLAGGFYSIVNVTDNTKSRAAVTVDFIIDGFPQFANDLPVTPTALIHLKIQIADGSETAGLSFEQSLMVDQQYEQDRLTIYTPVIAGDTDDSSLPVQLSGFSAEVVTNGVLLQWKTESEIDNLGFYPIIKKIDKTLLGAIDFLSD